MLYSECGGLRPFGRRKIADDADLIKSARQISRVGILGQSASQITSCVLYFLADGQASFGCRISAYRRPRLTEELGLSLKTVAPLACSRVASSWRSKASLLAVVAARRTRSVPGRGLAFSLSAQPRLQRSNGVALNLGVSATFFAPLALPLPFLPVRIWGWSGPGWDRLTWNLRERVESRGRQFFPSGGGGGARDCSCAAVLVTADPAQRYVYKDGREQLAAEPERVAAVVGVHESGECRLG